MKFFYFIYSTTATVSLTEKYSYHLFIILFTFLKFTGIIFADDRLWN